MGNSKSSATMWYGPVALAGVLFFLANNGLSIWDRTKASEIFVEASSKAMAEVKPDTAKIVFTAKHMLADSAKLASAGIGKKVEDFSAFATQILDVKLAVLPISISQEVIQIGEKFARSYTATQRIEVTVKDFKQIQKLIDQGIAIEIGDIGGTEFSLTSSSSARKSLREKVLKEANDDALAKAKELGRSLDKMVDFSENTNSYDSDNSDLQEIIEELDGVSQENQSSHAEMITIYQNVSVKYSTK